MIAHGLTTHRRDVATAAERGNDLAHTLLGIERAGYGEGDKLAAYLETNPTKAQHVSLAVVLGGIESSTSKNTWRYPEPTKAAYLPARRLGIRPLRRRTDRRHRRGVELADRNRPQRVTICP